MIIVEGAHDLATLERILRLHKINKVIRHKSELPDVWKRMIPDKYPFHGDDLDRISPVPSFWANDDVSVAIKCAGADSSLIPCLKELCSALKISEKMQLQKIMLVCDADKKTAEEKKTDLLSSGDYDEEFRLIAGDDGMTLQLEQISEGEYINIPVVMYAFPDDKSSGTLEDLLLEAAKEVYPELMQGAESYVNSVDTDIYPVIKDKVRRSKATVGCIANILKPGKANQVAVADGDWIGNKSLNCDKVNKLSQALSEFVEWSV